jgi:two-component system nitrogen regulation sensor histidine kinase NtrY
MPATVTSITPRRAAPPPAPDAGGQAPKRPLRDNTRLILAGIALLRSSSDWSLANRTPQFTPDSPEFVLYALTAADLTMLVALVFVLARNIIKLIVERRRALPFARFRAKLVALLLGMTLVPATLVLIVGSELIRTNIDRWFNAPMGDILTSANQIAGDYYSRQTRS